MAVAPPPSPLAIRPNVVGVIAVDALDVLAPFSRYGSNLVLAAPGVDIQSAYPAVGPLGPGYTTGSGTSFATPLVAGSIATIMDAGNVPALTALAKLVANAKSVTPTSACQHGRVDPLGTALQLLAPDIDQPQPR